MDTTRWTRNSYSTTNNGVTAVFDTYDNGDDPVVLTHGTVFDTNTGLTFVFEIFLREATGINNPGTTQNSFAVNSNQSVDWHTNHNGNNDVSEIEIRLFANDGIYVTGTGGNPGTGTAADLALGTTSPSQDPNNVSTLNRGEIFNAEHNGDNSGVIVDAPEGQLDADPP